MTIAHSVPSTTRKPGQFHEFDLVSGARGLTPLANRVLLIGEKTAGGTATADLPVEIFDENQAETLFGQGSTASLMCRKALEAGISIGFRPEIWAAGIADPAGTATTFTITVQTGSASADGTVVFRIAGRTLSAGVSSGDDQTAIALAIVAAIEAELSNLPVTAGSALGVVTCTAVITGILGEDISYEVVDVGLIGLTVIAAAGVTGVGAALPATALANSLTRYYECKVLANHASADITVLLAHVAAAWAAAAKRWCFCFVGEPGTLSAANTLSAAGNHIGIEVVSYEGCPNLPGEIAAAAAVAVSAREQPNYNWDGQEIPLYVPADSDVYTDAEIESALAAGSTPLLPNDPRTTTEIVRMITTKTLEGGNPFENAKDLATIRGMVYVVRQLDTTFSQQFLGVNKSEQVLKRMRSVAYRILKATEELEITQNVDALFPQLIVETDPNVATRAVLSIPESIVPNLHQTIFVHVLYVE